MIPVMSSSVNNLPLRWESTGDQWWYASPIDWAAANGSYDLVRGLLSLDSNLLIKLTSLRRIRRLESVWDDEVSKFDDVPKRRADVALTLFRECDPPDGNKINNSLIRAGYGGWLVYTAASAGDVAFVKELLDVDPFLVFGEGEYGVSDVFYAGARSGNAEVFRLLVNAALMPVRGVADTAGGDEFGEVRDSVVKDEVMNRAVHAAARGGFLKMVKEISGDGGDVLRYKDHQGCNVLHSAAAKGHVEVVRDLIASFGVDPIAKDNQGNTALHVAAYRGHSAVVDALLGIGPSSISVTNNNGDTFLHMAVAGFRMPGFHRIDKQVGLLKHLVSDGVVNLREIVNVRNKDGRNVLHLAIVEKIPSEVVELLMTTPSIGLNCGDNNGMTPLDHLKKRAQSADFEYLMRRVVAAGGRYSFIDDRSLKNALVSKLKMQGIMSSPGTSFRIPDGELLVCTANEKGSSDKGNGIEIDELSRASSAVIDTYPTDHEKKSTAPSNVATRLRQVFHQAMRKDSKKKTNLSGKNDSMDFSKIQETASHNHSHVPLRQRFAKSSFHPTNLKTFPLGSTLLPSASTKETITPSLQRGVIPRRTELPKLSLNSFSRSSSCASEDIPKTTESMPGQVTRSHLNHNSTVKNKLINTYFCFGAHSVAVANIMRGGRPVNRAISMAN